MTTPAPPSPANVLPVIVVGKSTLFRAKPMAPFAVRMFVETMVIGPVGDATARAAAELLAMLTPATALSPGRGWAGLWTKATRSVAARAETAQRAMRMTRTEWRKVCYCDAEREENVSNCEGALRGAPLRPGSDEDTGYGAGRVQGEPP